MSDETGLQSIEGPTTYDRWVAEQGVPLVTGVYLEDIRSVEVTDWPRKGGRGAIVRLDGCEDRNDAHVIEIPPGGEINPERHLYEELIYVAEGRGSTTVWNGQGTKSTFEWQKGSVFGIPLNTWSQHFNGSGSERARFYGVTTAPLMMNLFHNQDFIFDLEFDFTDRFGQDNDDFSGAGALYTGKEYKNRIWDTKFIADTDRIELQAWKERGHGSASVLLEIADSSMCGHVTQWPVGRYKKAHRHQAGAHVVILSGEGYSLLWYGDKPKQRVDWKPGSVLVPANEQFHQHFTTSRTPTRQLALRWSGKKYPVFKPHKIATPTRYGGDQIEFYDEDPEVRKLFAEELSKQGIPNEMHDGLYAEPTE
jgi:mannose-6-phosphate isomerase-like protein (cupin superfamily)